MDGQNMQEVERYYRSIRYKVQRQFASKRKRKRGASGRMEAHLKALSSHWVAIASRPSLDSRPRCWG